MRKEKDGLGERLLPDEAYYGIQTLRAMENFAISDNTFAHYPNIVRAMAEIKKACALTNKEIGALPADIADAIATACDEMLAGRYPDQFPVNVFRGCGTSINMNVNEVIAHLAGEHGVVLHPNDHVNRSQSSNDTFPSALHIAAVLAVVQDVLPAAHRLGPCKVPFCLWPGTRKTAVGTRCGGTASAY